MAQRRPSAKENRQRWLLLSGPGTGGYAAGLASGGVNSVGRAVCVLIYYVSTSVKHYLLIANSNEGARGIFCGAKGGDFLWGTGRHFASVMANSVIQSL